MSSMLTQGPEPNGKQATPLAAGGGDALRDPPMAETVPLAFESVREFALAEAVPARMSLARQPQIKWFGSLQLTFSASYLLGIPNDRAHANCCLLAEQAVYAKLPHWSR